MQTKKLKKKIKTKKKIIVMKNNEKKIKYNCKYKNIILFSLKREREKAFKQCNLQLILHANLIVLRKRNYICTNLNIKHKQKALTPLLDSTKKLPNCKKITITHYVTILLTAYDTSMKR